MSAPAESALDQVLWKAEEGRASSWPPLTSDRLRLVTRARTELEKLRSALRHAVQRTHQPSAGCTPCQWIEELTR